MAERLRLAQCLRCKGYTYLSTDGPLAWACDVSPATRDGYVSALVRRLGLYDVRKRPRGSLEARGRPLGTPAPSFGPTGAQEAAESLVHVEHSCGAGAKDQRPVAVVAPKASARVTPGAPKAGSHPQAARVAGGRSSFPARPASRPLLKNDTLPYAACGTCRKGIRTGESYWGIQHGHLWIYCEHEDCP